LVISVWSPFPDANLIGSYIENVIQEREIDQHFELPREHKGNVSSLWVRIYFGASTPFRTLQKINAQNGWLARLGGKARISRRRIVSLTSGPGKARLPSWPNRDFFRSLLRNWGSRDQQLD
jgi:hypothetical protein